jgi:hypothetical protein
MINEADVENMRRVADAFPRRRFEAFVLFAKLSAFSLEEIALAKDAEQRDPEARDPAHRRELEPYQLYERTEKSSESRRTGDTRPRWPGQRPKSISSNLGPSQSNLAIVRERPQTAYTMCGTTVRR